MSETVEIVVLMNMMNMSNITFEVRSLSTFVFKKSSEKTYSRLYSWLRG